MGAFALLLAALGAGLLAARLHPPARQASRWLDAWVLNVALPAMVLRQIPQLEPAPGLVAAAAGPWIVALGALLLMPLAGRWLGWSRGRIGALVMSCGFGNTAFLGLPMVAALRGESALPIAVVADQAGSFLALSTIGLAAAAGFSGSGEQASPLWQRLLRFAPFPALLLALAVGAAGGWPEWLDRLLALPAATLAPVALCSVGLRLRFSLPRGAAPALAIGLAWKLLAAPALVLAVAGALGAGGEVLAVAVLQAAMAPMITAAILAVRHGLEPELALAILGVGILASFATVPLWQLLLG